MRIFTGRGKEMKEKFMRKVEVWKKVEERTFPSATQQRKFFFDFKKNNDKAIARAKIVDINLGKRDTTLTGVDKEVSKYQEELPKPTREERLKKFKDAIHKKEVTE